jgi:Tfp pilus assembly protein PilO
MEWLKGTVTPKDWIANAAIIVIAIAVCVAYVMFVRTGQSKSLDLIKADHAQVTRDIQEARAKERAIDDLRRDTDKLQTLVKVFDDRLPTERELPLLIRQFESLANAHSLPHKLTPQRRVKDENKETIPYEITTFGTFHQTVSFINSLEGFERYFKITDLEINENKDGIQEATFELKTFRFLEKNGQPAAPANG